MDLKERNREGNNIVHRHPWELSRTGKVLQSFAKYLDTLQPETERRYVNIGAGDLYFDNILLKKYKRDTAYAVDLEYDKSVPDYPRIEKFHYLDEVPDGMDYGIMMDSLEYMPDDTAYVKALSKKVRNGGFLFFTLPAIPSIFSEHDRNVENLRRYDRRGFERLVASVPELEIVESHYFYTCLYLVRYLQVRLKLSIDKEKKVTTGWKYSEKNFITRCIVGILNADFVLNRRLAKAGLSIPGLSLLVVCRKKDRKA